MLEPDGPKTNGEQYLIAFSIRVPLASVKGNETGVSATSVA